MAWTPSTLPRVVLVACSVTVGGRQGGLSSSRHFARCRELNPPHARRAGAVVARICGQSPCVDGAAVGVLLDREQNMPATDVLVLVGPNARMPAMPGELAVGD